MNAKRRQSLIGGFAVKNTVDKLSENNLVQRHAMNRRTLTARLCTIKGKPSGGIVLSISGPARKHIPFNREISRRLRPGWTKEQCRLSFSMTDRELSEGMRLDDYRDHAMRICEQYIVPDDLPDKGIKNHSIDYAEMSPADCGFWINYAKDNWQLKNETVNT